MSNLATMVNRIITVARGLGIKAEVEEYGRERVVILELGEDFGIYVSVICNNDCDVEYAIGDENFTFRPNQLDLVKRAVEIIEKLNTELTSGRSS